MSCSRTQRSASGEARTRNPSISGQALYHDCALQLGSILCRYDTCPTQYAPDLRGSILCMQGTQYATRESILSMEHFVALHSPFPAVDHEATINRRARTHSKHTTEITWMIHKRCTALERSVKYFTGGLKPVSRPQPHP